MLLFSHEDGNLRDWTPWQAKFLAYRAGDAGVVTELFEHLQSVLRAFFLARTRSGSLADDLTQATLLKIHLARDRYRAELKLQTWVFTIAQRCLIDHWRGRRDEVPDPDPEGEAADLPRQLAQREDLLRALESLKPTDRSIVYLYAVEGLSMAEIAQGLGTSEGAVKIRAHRSYQKLREFLGAWALALLWEGFRRWQ